MFRVFNKTANFHQKLQSLPSIVGAFYILRFLNFPQVVVFCSCGANLLCENRVRKGTEALKVFKTAGMQVL